MQCIAYITFKANQKYLNHDRCPMQLQKGHIIQDVYSLYLLALPDVIIHLYSMKCVSDSIFRSLMNVIAIYTLDNYTVIGKQRALFQPYAVLQGTPVCRQRQLLVSIQCFQLDLTPVHPILRQILKLQVTSRLNDRCLPITVHQIRLYYNTRWWKINCDHRYTFKSNLHINAKLFLDVGITRAARNLLDVRYYLEFNHRGRCYLRRGVCIMIAVV